MVGSFVSKEAMAGVGSNTPLINLLINLVVGVSLGSNVVIATLTGQAFAYDVREDTLAIRRSDMVLARDEIAAAYKAGTSDKPGSGRGTAAYINAILRDNRIRS